MQNTNVNPFNCIVAYTMVKHILNILFFNCVSAYTMAKYGMSMCVLGMAAEFKDDGIAVNALWPKTGMLSALSL